jgi:peptide/nickel transport system ATP-binding protein
MSAATAIGDSTNAARKPARLLDVRDLGISFATANGRLQATHDLNFSIARGERIGVVGESGCGKTITGLSLLRLLPESAARVDGHIDFDGVDLATCSDRQLRAIRGGRIGMIFQEPMSALDPVFTIGEQIAEGLRAHTGVSRAEARTRTLESLRAVGIAAPHERYDSYPHQLSGGMRQRVMIAGAMICGPQLLIADEPTTALDVTVQAQILDLLRKLSDESHMALLFITHDLGVVAETCTRMLTMYAGEIVEDGPVDAALERPLHPYTSGLLRALPHLSERRGALPSIPGRVPSLGQMPQGCRFQPRCPYATDGCERTQSLQTTEENCNVVGARSARRISDARTRRHRQGRGWRQFRYLPRRNVRADRRIRIGQDDDRPRGRASRRTVRRTDPARWRRPRAPVAPRLPQGPPRLADRVPGSERRAQSAQHDSRVRAGALATGRRGLYRRSPRARARSHGARRPAG